MRIPNTPIVIDEFRYIPGVYIYLLTHMHSDHTSGLTPSWNHGTIYCTRITRALLLDKFQVNDASCVVALDEDESHSIPLDNDNRVSMQLTLIDANHCPGACMFLMQGYFGSVLHTGDFRFDPLILDHPALKSFRPLLARQHGQDEEQNDEGDEGDEGENEVGGENKVLDALYLDDTFLDPDYEFPTRRIAGNQLLQILEPYAPPTTATIGNNMNASKALMTRFVIGMDTLGKEELLIAVALKLKSLVVVDEERLRMLNTIRDATSSSASSSGTGIPHVFTHDERLGRVIVVGKKEVYAKMRQLRTSCPSLPVIGILPSGWSVSALSTSNNQQKKGNPWIHRVAYSLHSSYSELISFVSALRPKCIYSGSKHDNAYVQRLLGQYCTRLSPPSPSTTSARGTTVMDEHEAMNQLINKIPRSVRLTMEMRSKHHQHQQHSHTGTIATPIAISTTSSSKSPSGGTASAKKRLSPMLNPTKPSRLGLRIIHSDKENGVGAGGDDDGLASIVDLTESSAKTIYCIDDDDDIVGNSSRPQATPPRQRKARYDDVSEVLTQQEEAQELAELLGRLDEEEQNDSLNDREKQVDLSVTNTLELMGNLGASQHDLKNGNSVASDSNEVIVVDEENHNDFNDLFGYSQRKRKNEVYELTQAKLQHQWNSVPSHHHSNTTTQASLTNLGSSNNTTVCSAVSNVNTVEEPLKQEQQQIASIVHIPTMDSPEPETMYNTQDEMKEFQTENQFRKRKRSLDSTEMTQASEIPQQSQPKRQRNSSVLPPTSTSATEQVEYEETLSTQALLGMELSLNGIDTPSSQNDEINTNTIDTMIDNNTHTKTDKVTETSNVLPTVHAVSEQNLQSAQVWETPLPHTAATNTKLRSLIDDVSPTCNVFVSESQEEKEPDVFSFLFKSKS